MKQSKGIQPKQPDKEERDSSKYGENKESGMKTHESSLYYIS